MKGHVQNGARGGLANVRKILAKILTVQPVRGYEASTPPGRPGTDPRYAQARAEDAGRTPKSRKKLSVTQCA